MPLYVFTRSILIGAGPTPCTALSDVRQVPTLSNAGSGLTLMARSDFTVPTRPIIGRFDLPH